MTAIEEPASAKAELANDGSVAGAAAPLAQADADDPAEVAQPPASLARRWAQTLKVHLSVIIPVPLMLLTSRHCCRTISR